MDDLFKERFFPPEVSHNTLMFRTSNYKTHNPVFLFTKIVVSHKSYTLNT